MANLDKEGIEFLNRLYKDMYKSDEVMHGIDERFIGNKTDNIGHYIDRMQELHERVASSGRENDLRMLKEFYYRKYVIKEEDIPDAYYEHQKEIYLERGYGHIEFSEKDKHEMANQIINDQKKRLDIWIEYFVSNDSSYIPMWAKYWAFQGMLSLGNYDKQNKTFGKRSKGTISPFVDLNREALALSIDFLLKTLRKEEIDDKQLEVLVQGGSFGKIYSYILTNVLSKNNSSKKSTDGRWVRYSRGSDHMPLVKSLQGYNTGWCTAGEGTAKSQLKMGDFYVYYTHNEKGEAVVPRIAIRMEGNRIGEVRGVATDQNLESEMEGVAETKLNEFSDKDRYKKKVSDMKMLTTICKKHKNNEELTKKELRFLYELDEKIEGFGYKRDPRISELISLRNQVCDLNYIFEGIEEYDGSLNLSTIIDAKGLRLPRRIKKGLSIEGLVSAEGLVFPEIIGGSLYLGKLTSAKGLNLPKVICGTLFLGSLTNVKGLIFPEVLRGDLDLGGLTSAKELKLPTTLGGSLYLGRLKSPKGLNLPETINGELNLGGLVSAKGLKLPNNIEKDLVLKSLISARDLNLPKTIGGTLYLGGLTSAEGLNLPEIIGGALHLGGLISAKGLKLPEAIGGYLCLGGLTSAKGLKLSKTIKGALYLESLTSAEDLIFPEAIGGPLVLWSLTSSIGLNLPQTINGYLDLRGLRNVEDLKLPRNINGDLKLDHLTCAKCLQLPEIVDGEVNLRSLTKIENLKLPKIINGSLRLDNLRNVKCLQLPQTINGDIYLYELNNLNGIILPEKFNRIYLANCVVTPEIVYEYINKPNIK